MYVDSNGRRLINRGLGGDITVASAIADKLKLAQTRASYFKNQQSIYSNAYDQQLASRIAADRDAIVQQFTKFKDDVRQQYQQSIKDTASAYDQYRDAQIAKFNADLATLPPAQQQQLREAASKALQQFSDTIASEKANAIANAQAQLDQTIAQADAQMSAAVAGQINNLNVAFGSAKAAKLAEFARSLAAEEATIVSLTPKKTAPVDNGRWRR
jgi:hypothetical protein